MEALDTLVYEGVIFIWLEHGGDVMGISGTAQHRQADVAYIHIQAVLAVVEQAKAIRDLFVTRDAGNVYPGLAGLFFSIRKALRVSVGNLVRDLHEFHIDRKAQLEHLALLAPVHGHADVDLLAIGVHGEVLDQLG